MALSSITSHGMIFFHALDWKCCLYIINLTLYIFTFSIVYFSSVILQCVSSWSLFFLPWPAQTQCTLFPHALKDALQYPLPAGPESHLDSSQRLYWLELCWPLEHDSPLWGIDWLLIGWSLWERRLYPISHREWKNHRYLRATGFLKVSDRQLFVLSIGFEFEGINRTN